MSDNAPASEPRPTDGRDESPNQRSDRNWEEILQELRVTQTGTQILTGFLLTLAFQPRFAELDTYQIVVYLALVAVATATTVLGLAPVSLHRALFGRGVKQEVVAVANRILRATLVAVAALIVGVILLIFDVVVGRAAGLIAAAIAVVAIIVCWLLVPFGAGRIYDRGEGSKRRSEEGSKRRS
jgi:membrane-bound metal-dependent hydrolase YbcI (DUF457 family)